jgi:hypothetical protein
VTILKGCRLRKRLGSDKVRYMHKIYYGQGKRTGSIKDTD